MPELPELELLRRDLDREIGERKVKSTEVPVAGIVGHPTKKALIGALDGAKLSGVTRRGTLLLLGVEGTHALVLSIGDQTRLTRNQPKDELVAGTALVLTFTQGGQLRIGDPKKQAKVEYLPVEEIEERHPELLNLGLDPVDEPISWTTFGEAVLRRDGKIKAVLMDPTFMVGVVSIYSYELLFHAVLRYDRVPSSLSAQEIRRLYRAVVETVHEAVKYGGTTIGPDGWVGLSGESGDYQQYIAVYKRDGEMSPRARGPIVKARFGSGYTYFCQQTQV